MKLRIENKILKICVKFLYDGQIAGRGEGKEYKEGEKRGRDTKTGSEKR